MRLAASNPSRIVSKPLSRYRPVIELLERRLPPGSMLTSLFLGGSSLALAIDEPALQTAFPVLRMREQEKISPEPIPAIVTTRAGMDAVTQPPTQGVKESTSDLTRVAASAPPSRAVPSRLAMSAPGLTSMSAAAPMASRLDQVNSPSRAFGEILSRKPDAFAGASSADIPMAQQPDGGQQSEVLDNYGKLPVSFEQNVGQFDERVDFVSRGGGSTMFLTPTAAVFAVQNSESENQKSEVRIQNSEPHEFLSAGGESPEMVPLRGLTPSAQTEMGGVAVYMNVVGANPDAQPTATNQQPGITNYFIGNDPNEWHTDIESFGRVEYDEVYPGIDLAYYGNNGELEYDFIVSPGADPSAIALNFAGADGLEINAQGDLVVHTAAGDVVQQKPFTYQEVGSVRQEVPSGYIMAGNTVRFQLGSHDPSRPLVIDPVLGFGYSTFLGGAGPDGGNAIRLDAGGNAYVTGGATSTNFPTTPGAFDTTHNGNSDVFVTKLNATGSSVVYSTYFGGTADDEGFALALDGANNVYVTGGAFSTNSPTTAGAFDTTHNGLEDAFVTKLNASGTALIYSTLMGGTGEDSGFGLAVDSSGAAYLTGEASSTFPTTAGALDTTYNGLTWDVFVAKLNSSGSGLSYSTFLGGNGDDVGFDITIDNSGNFYATGISCSPNYPTVLGSFDNSNEGCDAIVTKMNSAGTALIYSTFLGGSSFFYDYGVGIALDGSGNAYVTGQTESSDFPTTPGAVDTTWNGSNDVYVTKLNATGSALVYSTFLGGTGQDTGYDIALNGAGEAHIVGYTTSISFPTTAGGFEDTDAGFYDGFATKLNATGSALSYSTLLGGNPSDFALGLALNGNGDVYMTGQTAASNFPATPGAFDTQHNGSTDAFVTKLRTLPQGCTCFQPRTITTAANGANGVFAADVDSDGDMDVLSSSNQDDKIAWYENNGSESFTAHTITTTADVASSVFAADVDSDGDMDVLSSSRNDDKIAWYRNNGSEVFTAIIISTSANDPSMVYAADLNQDGDMDVLSASFLDDKIAWYENNGSESFTARTISTTANGAVSVTVGDVDGDGDLDVLSASTEDDKIAWYENNGSQTFTAQTITTTANFANGVTTADLDNDGDLDVLSSSNIDDKIAWYENNGSPDPSFTTRVVTTVANGAVEVTTADIDADGDIDVISASNLDNKIAWYENSGNGSFTAQTITTGAIAALGVFAADVDSDGDTDVLSASFADDKIAWYENRSRLATPGPGQSDPGNPIITLQP